MKGIVILVILLILVQFNSAKSYDPIKLKWEYPVKADAIYSFDLDADGIEEIYVPSYGDRNYLYAFDQNGTLMFDTKIQGYKEYFGTIYPNAAEELSVIYPADLDNDKNLDILVGSKIWGAGVNVNKLYLLKREIEKGFSYYKNNFKQVYGNAGSVTEISALDFYNDGNKVVLSASLDGNIYIFDISGNIKKNYDLGESVWSIFPVKSANNVSTDIVAGLFRGISLISDNSIKWKYKTESRVSDVFAGDLNDDTRKEVIAASDDNLYVLNMSGNLILNKEIDGLSKVSALDIDNDSKKEILAASKNGSIYFIGINGSVTWEFGIDDTILSAYTAGDNLFIGGRKNLYAFELNADYIRNLDAERYYSKAYEYFINGDYENAKNYAEKAKDIYLEINNVEGILKSESILLTIKSNGTSDEKKELADFYYGNAVKNLNSSEFEDALLYAQKALTVYSGINYTEGIAKTNSLISEINSKAIKNRKSEADKYYLKAFDYYIFKKDLENSTIYAEKARKLYSELNDSEGISKSDSLISEISRIIRKKLSDDYYSRAEDYYDAKDYANATIYAEKAKEIYVELNFSEQVSKADSLIESAGNHIAADSYYAIALGLYNDKEYKNATAYAKMAKDIYLELNDGTGVSNSGTLLLEIDKKTKEKETADIIPIAVGIIAFVIILLFVIKRLSSHKKIPR